MLWKGTPLRPLAGKGPNRGCLGSGHFGGKLVFGCRRFEILEFELELIEQPGLSFGPLPIKAAPELFDLKFETGDLGLAVSLFCASPSHLSLGLRGLHLRQIGTLFGRGKSQAKGSNLGVFGRFDHVETLTECASCHELICPVLLGMSHRVAVHRGHPADSGRQVFCGMRQSIPSSR